MTTGNVNGITPGIQNSDTIVNIGGVRITSDLGPQWNGTVSGLLGLDYSSLGGNPIGTYPSGLTQIHLEYFNSSTAIGMNITNHGRLGTSYINAGGYTVRADGLLPLGIMKNMPGVDTIYIDATGLFGLDRNEKTIAGVIVHEFLHESKDVNKKAAQMTAQLKADFLADGKSLAEWSDIEAKVKASAEHVVIGMMMDEFAIDNNLNSYRTFALGPKQYRAALEDALGMPRGSLKGSDAVPAELRYVTPGELVGGVGDMIDTALDRIGLVGDVIGDVLGGVLKGAGAIVDGVIGGVASVVGGIASGFSKLVQGDIVGAIGDVARGIGGGVRSILEGIGNAVESIGRAIGEAIRDVVDTVRGWFQPVVLDMDGDGIELTGMGQTGAAYDLDDDGYLENTGWIGQGDGLLAYDVNLDGKIEGARE